ncbi:MAG: COQ9 family protein [Proteobacteria bacterium]|nr:COQ9 family protein [Pseudomonadota bacterium]
MTAKKKTAAHIEANAKTAILEAALAHVPFDGFTDAVLKRAAKEKGLSGAVLTHHFPEGPASLVEAFSKAADAEMEASLAREKLAAMKIRERIKAAVLARIGALKPHKEAARRAAAFLTLPPHVALGAKLLYRTVDSMWRAVGDTSTDFNFYTKRAILAGVYSSTLLRWFTDGGADEKATHDFLDSRIENVMQFEKFKAELRKRAEALPSLSEILGGVGAQKTHE